MRPYLEVRRWVGTVCVVLLIIILGIVTWELVRGGVPEGEQVSGLVGLVLMFWIALSTWSFERMIRKQDTVWQVSMVALVCWAVTFLPRVQSIFVWDLSQPDSLVVKVWVVFPPVAVALDFLLWLFRRLLTSWRKPYRLRRYRDVV